MTVPVTRLITPVVGAANLEVADLNPLRENGAVGGRALKEAVKVMALVEERYGAVHSAKLAVRDDPDHAPELARKVEAQAKRDENAINYGLKAIAFAAGEIAKAQSALWSDDQPNPFAAETRQLVRSMSHNERRAFVLEAAKRGDRATVTAIIGAGVPHFLVGLDEIRLSMLRDTIAEQYTPPEIRAEAKAMELLQMRVDRALNAHAALIRDIVDTGERMRKKREAAAADKSKRMGPALSKVGGE
jgi:hypothetical protein